MSLIDAKPKLEQQLYNAFYDAYMTQSIQNIDEASSLNGNIEKKFDEAAIKFSQQLSKDMAQAIYEFAKEMSIEANVAGTVNAPSGPCTGSIPSTNFTIS